MQAPDLATPYYVFRQIPEGSRVWLRSDPGWLAEPAGGRGELDPRPIREDSPGFIFEISDDLNTEPRQKHHAR